MSRKRLFIAVVLILSIFYAGCAVNCVKGQGKVVTQQRDVHRPFDAIVVSGAFDLTVNYGENYTLRLEDYQNIIDLVKTEVKNNVLYVSYDENCVNNSKGKLFVTVPRLKAVTVAGSGDVKILGGFAKSDFFTCKIAGSGDILVNNNFTDSITAVITGSGDVRLTNDSLDYVSVKIAGSGDAFVQGNFSKAAKFSVAGSGDIDASVLPVDNAVASISGSGTCKVFALRKLQAKIAGSGDIYYKGEPEDIDFSTSGSGAIHKL